MDGRYETELSNVVRFPVELRVVPSMALVGELEPNGREVVLAGDGLGFDVPPADLCDRVDAETSRFIAEQVLPLTPEEQRRALDEMLRPVLAAAVAACRAAERASRQSAEAAREVMEAQVEGGHWMEPLEETAHALLHKAALAMIEAHWRCQEARGVSRAVGMARRGEAWMPHGPAAMSEWLAEAGEALWGAAWRGRLDGRDQCGQGRITVRALPLPSLTFASIGSWPVPIRDPRCAKLPESLRTAPVRQARPSGADLARRADHPPCCTAMAMTSFSSCPGFFPFT